MAQPLNIPILYTGKDIAVPDWKSFNQDFNARMANLSRQRQQQRQFDSLQNERMRKEFLNSIDLDQLNSLNEGLLEQKYQMTKGVEDWMTARLAERGGEPTDQDILEARMITNRVNQDFAKLNNWQKNQQLDIAAAQKNMGLYDQQKLKDNIVNWDGRTPYTQSRLDTALRDMPIEELVEGIRSEIKNPDRAVTTSKIAGYDVKNEEEFNATFNDAQINPKTGEIDYSPIDKNRIDYLKVETLKGNDAVLKQRTLDRLYNGLDENTKQDYGNQAVKAGKDAEDGKYLWLSEVGGLFEPKTGKVATQPIDEGRAGGGKELQTIDLRKTTTGTLADPVPLTGTIKFIDNTGNEKTVNVGKNAGQLTKISFEVNPKTGKEEWMVSGIVKRPKTTAEGFDPLSVAGNTIIEPIKIPFNEVKANIEADYNVLLPPQPEEIDLGF